MKISWISPEELLRYELQQQREEGKDVASWQTRWEEIQRDAKNEAELRSQALQLLDELNSVAPTNELSHNEPSELEKILAQRPQAQPALRKHALAHEELYDRILGGWLGRAAGCLLA